MAKKKTGSMPEFGPAPDALVRRFNEAIAPLDSVQSRKMFGYPAAFRNGDMFAGLFRDSMILRLGEADRLALSKRGGRPFEPMPGRPMREYVVVPSKMVGDPAELQTWIEKSAAFAATLEAKPKKK